MADPIRSESSTNFSLTRGDGSPSAASIASGLIAQNRDPVLNTQGLLQDLGSTQFSSPMQAAAVVNAVLSQLGPREQGELIRAQAEANGAPVPANDPGPSTATVVADLAQLTLDLTGIVDPTPISDGSNAVISAGRMFGALFSGEWGEAGGHFVNGAISVAGILPGLGDLAKAGKIGKWAETVADAITLAARSPAARAAMEAPLREIQNLVNRIPQGALDALPSGARESLERMKTQLDDFFAGGARAADARAQVRVDGGSTGDWPRELNTPTLRANTDYNVNGYTYRTNANGQVDQVSGRLDLSTADRNGYQQRVAGRDDRLPDDQGGHLIASIFNGPGDRVNLVPMDGNLNMGRWRDLERTLADALESGRTVDVNINVRYPNGSARPDAFRIEYTIDGSTQVQTFRNRPGG